MINRFVNLKRGVVVRRHELQYAPRHVVGLRSWLTALASWYLKRVGWLTLVPVSEQVSEQVTVDGRALARFIKTEWNRLSVTYDPELMRDAVLVMGARDFDSVLQQEPTFPFSFKLADFAAMDTEHPELLGMTVVLLPWVEGVCIVPRSYLPLKRELVPSGVMIKEVEVERED